MRITDSLESVNHVSSIVGCSKETARHRIKMYLDPKKPRWDEVALFMTVRTAPRELAFVIVEGKICTSRDLKLATGISTVTAIGRMKRFADKKDTFCTDELFAPPYTFKHGRTMPFAYRKKMLERTPRRDNLADFKANAGISVERLEKLDMIPSVGSWEEMNL